MKFLLVLLFGTFFAGMALRKLPQKYASALLFCLVTLITIGYFFFNQI